MRGRIQEAGLEQFNHAWRQAFVLVLSSWWFPDRGKRWVGRKELNGVLEEFGSSYGLW